MVRSRCFALVLALALVVSCSVPLAAQNNNDGGTRWKAVPVPVAPAPFAVDASDLAGRRSIEFRPADQMSQADRLFAADAESSISERAGMSGLEFQQGTWSYQQVVCPALPNHLFLQYTRNGGAGDVSIFSASIPRSGEGRVRIIPIRRRGYSLFSPAPINALTLSTFNHIRAEEPEGQRTQGWLGNGLCYAALAGGHPQLPAPDAEPKPGHPVPALSAFLDVKNNDGEVVRFVDEAAQPHPMLWSMTFTRSGKLVKAAHTPEPVYSERPVPKDGAVSEPRPVPPAQ